MNNNTLILERLINEDYGLEAKENSRWGKSVQHDSLVLDRQKGIFYWNSHEIVGDPLVYLTKIREWSFQDAKEYLRHYDYQDTFVYTVTPKENKQEDVIVYPKLVEVFHELGLPPEKRDYWYRRGINDETIDTYSLGWYNDFNMIPIFLDGTFRNFQMRTDRPEKMIRSYYRGVGALLYNTDFLRYMDTAFICEGLTDCLRLNQEKVYAVSHNTGAGGWQDEWFRYFIKQKEIYVVFDNDIAGRLGAKKVAKILGTYRTKIYTFSGQEESYDIVNFFKDGGTKEQFLELVKEESKYSFEL